DIKPSNLLLDERDVVWLTDFGLARDDTNASMTLSGDVIGTARYMSPEQAKGGRSGLDKRTDVYSLGATLYELLTLQPPYDSESREAVLSQIAFADPPPPRRINPHIPRDLETIVLKCMQKNAGERYASAADIAEDCRRFLAGEPIRARRTSVIVKATRFVRRRPLHTAGVSLAILLSVAIGVLIVQNRRTRSDAIVNAALDAILFEDNTNRANELLDQAEDLGANSGALHLYRGLIPLLNAQPQRAVPHLQEAYRRDPEGVETCYALSAAFYALGDTVNGDRYFEKAETRPIQSALGWLLRGHALSRIQAPDAIEAFNQAVALRADFTPAIEARAYYRGYRLLTEGNDADLQPMLNDFDAWVVFRPDAPRSYAARASGWMFAAGHAMDTPALRANLADWLDNCQRDLKRAEALSGGGDVSILTRESVYLRLLGDFDGAADVLDRAIEIDRAASLGQHEGVVYHRSIALYAGGHIDTALAEVEPASASLPDFAPLAIQEALLLAESGDLVAAQDSCRRTMARQRHQMTGLCLAAAAMRLLGARDEATVALADFGAELAAAEHARAPGEGVTAASIRYLRNELDADAFLRQSGDTPGNRCSANLLIAMTELGRGERTEGRRRLRACVDTGVFIFVEHRLAQALLARSDADPSWPRWIE
ncbi:MAG: protein kinase, partial [Phycisphaerales bacterium]|nr:protein kinase [Phycisphaerales bacterium]